jgi:tetratricopeptide (TPR) repeat protein
VHFHRRELEAFTRESDRALALSPNNSLILAAVGMWSSFIGHWDRGVALIRKAQALNPYHPGWYHFPLAINHYRNGEYEQAAAAFTKINTPGWYQMHVGLAASYAQLGRKQEAEAAVKALLERKPDFLADPRHFYRTRNMSHDLGERLMDGLRKAGLDISPETL